MNRVTTRIWPSLVLGIVGVVLAAVVPWLRTFASFPNESLDVSVLYRHAPLGDIQYFPLIPQLARGSFTDGSVKESEGEILRSFPHATILPHAVFFALFGQSGYLVTDVAVSICYFLLLVLLLRTMGISRALGTVIAFLLTLGASGASPLISTIWGTRIPRPFISELFLLAIFVSTLRLLVTPRVKVAHWLWLAASFGLLVQGDLHSALTFALVSPFVIVCVARRGGIPATLRSCLSAGLLFFVVVFPFLMQRLFDHPDIPVRWGVFEVARTAGFAMYWQELFKPVLAVAVLCTVMSISVTAFWLPSPRTSQEATNSELAIERTWWFMITLLIIAFFCMPLSILVLGKTIQPYHFNDRAMRLTSYVLVIIGAMWIQRACKQRPHEAESHQPISIARRLITMGAMFALMFGFLTYELLVARDPSNYTQPLRPEYYPHAIDVQPNYRAAFSEVAGFLEENVPEDAVVATFDSQIYAWWMSFHGRHSFLIEPFISGVADEEIEIRLALLCKLLGMSTDEFIAFVQTPRAGPLGSEGYVHTYWLALGKYQASRLHTFAPIDDYTPDQQRAIRKTSNVWQKFIPQSELARLRNVYENVTLAEFEKRSLDVIVLDNKGPEGMWTPPKEAWQLEFENDGFRVYITEK